MLLLFSNTGSHFRNRRLPDSIWIGQQRQVIPSNANAATMPQIGYTAIAFLDLTIKNAATAQGRELLIVPFAARRIRSILQWLRF